MKQILIFAVLAAVAMPLLAEDSPEKNVAAYFAGMTGTNFAAAVKHVHPTDLAKIRDMVLPFLEKSAQPNGFPPKLLTFTRDNTIDEVRKLAPEEVFVRLMSWAAAGNPMWVTILKATTMESIGSVKDGESMHIVCRQTTTMGTNAPRTTASLVTVIKDNGEWKVTQPAEVQMVAQQFIRMGIMNPRAAASPPNALPPSFGPVAPRSVDPHAVHSHAPVTLPPATPKAATDPSPATPAATPAPPSATPAPVAK